MPYPTDYDSIIEAKRGTLPLEFVKALIHNESGFDPRAARNPRNTGAARGLMQVVGVVRIDYNLRHHTNYSPDDMFVPAINIEIGCHALQSIIANYSRFHPASLATDWNNKRWVEIVVFGWNAGYSESRGVGRIVGLIEKNGGPVTIDHICTVAQSDPVVSPHVCNWSKVSWSKHVANDFFGVGPSIDPTGVGWALLVVAFLRFVKGMVA